VTKQPPPAIVEEAKRHPGEWVYEIEGAFGPHDPVPPEAIRGAWAVNDYGQIHGDFIPNPRFGVKRSPEE
jgi:hypothetical protein